MRAKSDRRALELFGDLFDDPAPKNMTTTESGILVPAPKYDDDFDIISLMNSAKDPDTGLLRDLKIEDGDLAHATSYYDFCYSIIKDDAYPPWMMQMWIGVMLFAEYCPKCSDKRWTSLDWVLHHVDKATPAKEIAGGLQMLRHGVCPKCKSTKYDLIQNHGLVNYLELVNVLGQRAGKSASAASYSAYITHRYLKFPKLATLTRAMQKSTELTSTFVSLTFNKALTLLWTPFMNIINESSWFCLAEGSEITLACGATAPIESLEPGTMVRTLEGDYPVVQVFDNGVKECLEITLSTGSTLTGTSEHKVRCMVDGNLQWVTMRDLEPGHQVLMSPLDNFTGSIAPMSVAAYALVKEVNAVSTRHVYDIEVAEVHNYYANGVNVHNCSYHECLDHAANKYGIEVYRKKDEFIKYYHKSMRLYPSNPQSQTLRGDTRIQAVIDELGLFPLPDGNDDEEDDRASRANADEAHKSLTNSLVTVQAVHNELLKKGLNCPPALMMGVSSPISMKDKVMRLLADSRTDSGKKYILGVNLATWEVNPFLDRTSPNIAKAYATNPEKADRDFGAKPPRVSQAYIRPGQVSPTLFCGKQSHNFQYQYDLPGLLYGKVQRIYSPKYPSVVAIDAGFSNNSFSLVGGHFNFDTHKTVVTTVLEVMTHEGRKIDFNSVYLSLILPVLRDLNAVMLLADQWQSLDLLSRARKDMGLAPNGKARCITKQFSPRRKDFDSLVSMLENGNLLFPSLNSPSDYSDVESTFIDFRTLKEQPVKHLLLQMLTVRETDSRSAPTKGEGFTDDIFRALTLLTKIHDPKVMERLTEARGWVKDEGKGGMPTPVYVSYGGY